MSTNPRGERMVAEQLRTHGINHEGVLGAMAALPREEFVPAEQRRHAYVDHPLAIGGGQTISQPLVVAAMTQAAAPTAEDVALEIGAGSGYQAAVLARLCRWVVGVERDRELAGRSRATFARLGIANAELHHADGNDGWPLKAPYDVVVVSAAADAIPAALLDQLAEDGRLVIPLVREANEPQDLLLVHKKRGRLETRTLFKVLFVPLTGGTA
ncbi:MAG: protein-L-isoaspartate(D-aspartate) O-methyltransferase [Candidatus Dormibacteraeota bacterium]|nr:protein-L-isoaspartate(D-aspartate) O-methyltransferase [Candidatus Dormibacteraeota bacterium]